MPLSTRRALIGAGLAGGAALVVGCDDDAEPAAAPTPSATPSAATERALVVPDFDPADWESVRAQFPLDPAMSQFAAFVLSPHTAQVQAAIDFHRARLGFDTEQALLDGIELEDDVRAAAAAFAGGAPGQYALTDSTTMGLGVIYGGLALAPGDEVLSTTHDFFSTEDALRLLSLRTGAKVRRVTLYDDPAAATVDEMVDRLVAGVTPRTRVVAITWVHSSTGVRTPVARDRRRAPGRRAAVRRRGARVRRGGRRPARPRLRLPVRRHPQVAVRSARHRHRVGRDWGR